MLMCGGLHRGYESRFCITGCSDHTNDRSTSHIVDSSSMSSVSGFTSRFNWSESWSCCGGFLVVCLTGRLPAGRDVLLIGLPAVSMETSLFSGSRRTFPLHSSDCTFSRASLTFNSRDFYFFPRRRPLSLHNCFDKIRGISLVRKQHRKLFLCGHLLHKPCFNLFFSLTCYKYLMTWLVLIK